MRRDHLRHIKFGKPIRCASGYVKLILRYVVLGQKRNLSLNLSFNLLFKQDGSGGCQGLRIIALSEKKNHDEILAHPYQSALRWQPFFILLFMHYFSKYALYSGTMQSFWARVLSKIDMVLALIELRSHETNKWEKKTEHRFRSQTDVESIPDSPVH